MSKRHPSGSQEWRGGDHWWVDLSEVPESQLAEIRRKAGLRPGQKVPQQYIGKGKDAKAKAERETKRLRGAAVYNSRYGSNTQGQTIWARMGHKIVDWLFGGAR